MLRELEIFKAKMNSGRYSEFVDEICKNAEGRIGSYFLFVNSHMIYEYHTNTQLKEAFDKANYKCPDGVPLLKSMNLLRKSDSERVAGNDMIFSMLEQAYKRKFNIFFYGSTNEVLNKIKERIQNDYPGLQVDTYSPPFKQLTEDEISADIELINSKSPNLVFVGLGCPKQEIFMSQTSNQINAPMLGVGGAFLLYGGVDSRAPEWMRKIGMEWIYRLILEPKRLFKRYLITNTYFCGLFLKEFFKIKIK